MAQLANYNKEILKLAKRAMRNGEVPIGAIVVDPEGRIIGRGANRTHAKKDGLMHAELIALRQAQRKLADWRLEGCEVYVTLEPCLMCLGALGNARVAKVSYLLADPLFGSVESKLAPKDLARLYPKLVAEKIAGGEEVAVLMKEFFKGLRSRANQLRVGR